MARRFTVKNTRAIASFILLLFATCSISGCIGLVSGPKSTSSQQVTPGAATISVAPASINFGSVPIGSTASQSITISNGGGSNLTLTNASISAANITIAGMSLPVVIGAGKQAMFEVVFSPKAAGAVAGQVSILSDISNSPSAVSLSGVGTAATAQLTSSASTMSFGNVAPGKSSVQSVTLTNAGNSNVTISSVTVLGASYSTSGVSAGMILAPGQSATLDATFSPVTAGNFSGVLTVASNGANSPDVISLAGSSQVVSHFVTLGWTPSVSAVAGYNVYRSEVSGGPYSQLDSSLVVGDSYIDSNVQAGLTYYYTIKSVTPTGLESADSTQAVATIPNP